MELKKLSSMQLDILREIGNIGTGNAVTSMAELMNQRVDMETPSVNILTFDEMIDVIGGPETLIVAMFFRIEGDAGGTVYFILTIDEANHLVQSIAGDTTFDLLSPTSEETIGISALKEVGNIVTGSYLSALSDFTKINFYSSVPYLSVDMAGSILTSGIIDLANISDYVIIIDTKINNNNQKSEFQGHFLLIPDPESLPEIFKTLGVNGYE